MNLIQKLREKLKPVKRFDMVYGELRGMEMIMHSPEENGDWISFDAYQKREEMLMKVIEGLIEKLSNTRECMLILIDKPNGIKETLRADFIQHDQAIIDLINSEGETK